MASSIPLQLAETLQTAHINRSPSPKHDINPSTAASRKEPVTISESSQHDLLDDLDDDEDDDEEEIPYSVLRPTKRSAHLPPLPDLRFEQSYLHSIANADTWWKVALITARDQLIMPLAQGMLYNLALLGWQAYNRNIQLSGNSVGVRVRRWWWNVNNWPIPGESAKSRFVR